MACALDRGAIAVIDVRTVLTPDRGSRATVVPVRLLRTGGAASVSALAYGPDGTWLAAGCEDGRVCTFQLA